MINNIRGTTDYSERSEVYNRRARSACIARDSHEDRKASVKSLFAINLSSLVGFRLYVNALLVFRQLIGLLYEQCFGHISIGTGWVFLAPVLGVYKCFLR